MTASVLCVPFSFGETGHLLPLLLLRLHTYPVLYFIAFCTLSLQVLHVGGRTLKHSQADNAPQNSYKYTATQHKNMDRNSSQLWFWVNNDVAYATPSVVREAETRRGGKEA